MVFPFSLLLVCSSFGITSASGSTIPYVDATAGLWMHTTAAATASTQITLIPYDTTLVIQCVNPNGQAESGPYDTTRIWDFVTFEAKSGFVSDAWVYTGNNNATAPECTGSTSSVPTNLPTAPNGSSVFYTGEGAAGWNYAVPFASFILSANGSKGYPSWVGIGNCNPVAAENYSPVINGHYVSTLSGFSLGRLGPILLLEENSIYASHVDYILMFDPGNLSNLSGCDAHMIPNTITSSQLLANWLGSSSVNRLVIMAGALTQANSAQGIQDVYFPDIRGHSIASQVLVCNLVTNGQGWSHNDVMKGYAYMIALPAPSNCPSNFLGWHP